MAVSEQQKNEVRRLLQEGNKIEAIKYIKENFNLDLKQAKDLAEHIEDEFEIDSYQRATIGSERLKRSTKGGSKIGLFFGVIGMGIFAIAAIIFSNQVQLINKSISTTGVVIGDPAQPTFQYEFEGEIFTYQSSVNSSPPSYYSGEEVEIYVDTENPYNIIVNTITDRWFFIILLSSFGLVFSGVGLLVYKVMK